MTGASLVVPITVGVRTIGLLVLESTAGRWDAGARTTVQELVPRHALQLEVALLFEEVRSSARTEERKRLAREIHDGMAQELVFFGNALDNALSAARVVTRGSSTTSPRCARR